MSRGMVTSHCFGKVPIPPRLANVPFADDLGIVLGVKSVPIRNVRAPHNASLIRTASGYELFFRYDVVSWKSYFAPYFSRIGVVHLNDQFEQGEQEFRTLDLDNDFAEDPRAMFVGDQLYVFCNILDTDNLKCRSMCVANVDPSSFNVNYRTVLEMNFQWMEKNWIPFEYVGANQEPKLFLEYRISPRKLLEVPDPQGGAMVDLRTPKGTAYITLPWANKWGEPRGGTPFIKVGDEYLSFFHSGFHEANGLIWYVMGAYTSEAHPPFRITGISDYPILFRGIFDSPVIHTADAHKRVIFPAGIVVEKRGGKEIAHVSCGENDCAVKIVSFDLEKLMQSIGRLEK